MRNWGRVVVGVLLIALGGGWLLDMAGVVTLNSGVLASVGLMVIGAGLLIGSRQGNYPALVVIGIVLMLILASSERRSDRVLFRVDSVPHTFRPQTPDELRPYRADRGVLRIVLDELRLEKKKTHRVEARMQAGEIHVTVPNDVPVRVNARLSAGTLTIDHGDRDFDRKGVNIRETQDLGEFKGAKPRIVLDLRVGVGRIRVDDS
jgi:hypothetical protein